MLTIGHCYSVDAGAAYAGRRVTMAVHAGVRGLEGDDPRQLGPQPLASLYTQEVLTVLSQLHSQEIGIVLQTPEKIFCFRNIPHHSIRLENHFVPPVSCG